MYACNCTHCMEKTVHTVSLIQPVLFQEIAPHNYKKMLVHTGTGKQDSV